MSNPPTRTQMFRVSPLVAEAMEEVRRRGHHHVMAAFRPGLGPSPRAEIGALWHLDRWQRQLTIRSIEPPADHTLLGSLVRTVDDIPPLPGATVTVTVARNVQKTPPSRTPLELRAQLKEGRAYRSTLVIVPEPERPAWAIKRFAAVGLTVGEADLQIGPQLTARLGRGERLPYVELRARGVVTDYALFAGALRAGIGKGKNWGLGLIRLNASV